MNLTGVTLGGRYEIAEKLGAGGMAVVYRAQDTLLQRPVTVKVLRSELATDENVVKRFRREAQAAASLSHPNIVGVYDVGRQEDVHYIVMEYVPGKTLKEEIAERGPLPAEEAVRIARQIAEALRHAHAHRIIHRDVKPHNVLLTPEGRVKVTDFGIAGAATGTTVTYPGALLGTVYYFSPEQAQGRYGDERSDLYALGVVLYEMLTGQVPFEGESPVSVALKHIREAVRSPREINPRVPPAAERVVMKAMAKEGERRYQTAAEMLRDLEALQRQLVEWRSSRGPAPLPAGERDKTHVFGATKPPEGVQPGVKAGPAPGMPGRASARPSGAVPIIEDEAGEEAGAAGEVPGPGAEAPNVPAGGEPPGDLGPDDDYFELDEPAPAKPRRRLSRPVLWIASFAIFFIMVGTGLFLLVQFFEVPEVTVPNVVGMKIVSASNRLKERSLEARVVAQEYNSDYPNGQVFAQEPKAGATVKANRVVQLWVSLGPQLVANVPDVTGLSWREAKISLESVGLSVSESDFTYRTSETFGKDVVISQDPKPGASQLPQGTKVRLVVSLGPEGGTVVVPNFVGQTLDQARALLPSYGLTEGAITPAESSQPDGTILDQNPTAGTSVKSGAAIAFTVAGSGGSDTGGGGGETHEYLVVFHVPSAPSSSLIRIVVTDSQGERTVYGEREHAANYEGRVLVNWTGDTLRVQVYCNGAILEDYTVNAGE